MVLPKLTLRDYAADNFRYFPRVTRNDLPFPASSSRRGTLGNPDRVFNAALRLHYQGQFDEAARAYETLLKSNRDHADALHNLGIIRMQQRRLDEAHKLLRKAIYQRPKSTNFLHSFGLLLKELNQLEAAAARFREALAIHPDYPDARANLGIVCQQLNRHEEALQHFERVATLQPDSAQAHGQVGFALAIVGRLEAGQRRLEQAIELEPRNPRHYRILAGLKRFTAGDPHLAALERMADRPDGFTVEYHLELHFALAKAYADLEQHERAFRHLLKANALKRQQVSYDEATVIAEFTRYEALFSAEVIRACTGLGDPTPQPIFIVGMPRSGSTLIEQILASHPQIETVGESANFAVAAGALDPGRQNPADLGASALRRIAADYLTQLHARASADAPRITDKLLVNSRFVGLIHLAFPNARIIHARRGPLDTCLSCFSTLFDLGQHHYSYDLGELGRFWRAHDRLMRHWQTVLPEGIMLEVEYEALVGDLESHARRVVTHCGLEWSDACLEFHKAERPVYTASVTQVRQPIYRSSVDRWRPYQELLQPLFEGLGIDPPAA